MSTNVYILDTVLQNMGNFKIYIKKSTNYLYIYIYMYEMHGENNIEFKT
jgi:hypothetical protein